MASPQDADPSKEIEAVGEAPTSPESAKAPAPAETPIDTRPPTTRTFTEVQIEFKEGRIGMNVDNNMVVLGSIPGSPAANQTLSWACRTPRRQR